MKGIILCATQRCGSTMVVEDMRNTDILGLPEEYFIPWDSSRKDINWVEALERIKQRASTNNGFYSIKVMANHIPIIDACLIGSIYDVSNDNGLLYPRFFNAFKGCKFVFLKRDNVVRQAVSREISRQTGINHATGNASDDHFAGNLMKGYDTKYNKDVTYSFEAIAAEVLNISAENALWDMFFTSHNIVNPLVLRYEEICKNFPSYITRISRFAGMPLEEDIPFKNRNMVKLSNETNELWVSNFIKDSRVV